METPRNSPNNPTNARPTSPSNDIRPKSPIQATTPPRSQATLYFPIFEMQESIHVYHFGGKESLHQCTITSSYAPYALISISQTPTTSTRHPTTTYETTPSSIASLLPYALLCVMLCTLTASATTPASTVACTIRSTGSASI
jgi:hypothetical protein